VFETPYKESGFRIEKISAGSLPAPDAP